MIIGFLQDCVLTMAHIFGNLDTVNGVLAVAVVLIFGIAMKKLKSLITFTFLGLGAYVVSGGLMSLGQGTTPLDIALQQMWSETDYVTLRTFLLYFVSFSSVIGSIFLLKLGITKSD